MLDVGETFDKIKTKKLGSFDFYGDQFCKWLSHIKWFESRIHSFIHLWKQCQQDYVIDQVYPTGPWFFIPSVHAAADKTELSISHTRKPSLQKPLCMAKGCGEGILNIFIIL